MQLKWNGQDRALGEDNTLAKNAKEEGELAMWMLGEL